MIASIIRDLFSWGFLAGFVAGLVVQQAFSLCRARWLDRRRPLPNGRRRPGFGLDRVWLAGAIAFALMSWCVYDIQSTNDAVQNLSRTTLDCQQQFNTALRQRSQITIENDELSQKQRTALADWIHDLLFPPAEVAAMSRDDPLYKAWAIDRTDELNRTLADARAKEAANQQWRKDHPYPEPTCGAS